MFKEVQFLSFRNTRPVRRTVEIRQLTSYLYRRTDSRWHKFISMETWSDKNLTAVADFDFWLDLDARDKSRKRPEENLAASLPNCRLLVDFLHEKFDLDDTTLPVFFSGSGGFHILLPFAMKAPSTEEQVIQSMRQVASSLRSEPALTESWTNGADIDCEIYRPRGMIRAPWSMHRTGLRKTRLSRADLDLSPRRLLKLIKKRSAHAPETTDFDSGIEKATSPAFLDYVAQSLLRPASPPSRGDDFYNEALRGCTDQAPCLTEICEFSLPPRHGVFNKLKMFLLCQWKRLGTPQDVAVEWVSQFTDQFSMRLNDPPDKRRARLNDVQSAAKTIYRPNAQPSYDFAQPGRCAALIGGFWPKGRSKPCARFACPHAEDGPFLGQSTRVRYEHVLKKVRSPLEFTIFVALAIMGPARNIGELCERVRASQNTVKQAVNGLRQMGFVEIQAAGREKRIYATQMVQKSVLVTRRKAA